MNDLPLDAGNNFDLPIRNIIIIIIRNYDIINITIITYVVIGKEAAFLKLFHYSTVCLLVQLKELNKLVLSNV